MRIGHAQWRAICDPGRAAQPSDYVVLNATYPQCCRLLNSTAGCAPGHLQRLQGAATTAIAGVVPTPLACTTGQQCGPLAQQYVEHLAVAIDTLLAQPNNSARHLQVCRFWIQGTVGLTHHFALDTLCALDATLACWARVHRGLAEQRAWDEGTRKLVQSHALENLERTLCNWLGAMHERGGAQVQGLVCAA